MSTSKKERKTSRKEKNGDISNNQRFEAKIYFAREENNFKNSDGTEGRACFIMIFLGEAEVDSGF